MAKILISLLISPYDLITQLFFTREKELTIKREKTRGEKAGKNSFPQAEIIYAFLEDENKRMCCQTKFHPWKLIETLLQTISSVSFVLHKYRTFN